MFAYRNFLVFIPLSNWVRGFDRYRQTFDKAALPRARFPDCFYVLADDAPTDQVAAALAKTWDLARRLGVPGDRVVRLQCRLPVVDGPQAAQEGLFAAPNTFTGTGIGWCWPSTVLPLTDYAFITEEGQVQPAPHETITAAAFSLPDHGLHAWADCAPRSFSVLPVAQACNANCAFCFSKASMSDAVVPHKLDLESVAQWSSLARTRGASRAVITGGGEPMLIPFPLMEALIARLRVDFESILLITNGSRLVSGTIKHGEQAMLQTLHAWRTAGLSRLAISRHGTDEASDAALMGLAVPVAQALSLVHRAGIPSRLICVMQKGGVETPADVQAYLERAAHEGTRQVCFKELYVSSLSENPWAPSRENLYCQANQVPLSMLLSALEAMGLRQTATLPWGSPVYTGEVAGVSMEIAAYTEPSVGWERARGQVRSWNWMSNGECIASLEDPSSRLVAPWARNEHNARKPIPSQLVA